MNRLEARPIREYCVGIYDGPHATPSESSDGPVFLGIKNITENGRLDLSDIRQVSEDEFPKWTKRVTPQANDVVFTYEATLHRYAVIPEGFRGCLGRRVALVRPDTNQVDSRFLLYFFLSHQWRKVVESNVISGATVDRIPIEKFPSFPAALPKLPIQQKVADILSAYDELIENNQRRMALLEEAARQLYREWFVRLRFPGHEHTRITNGVPTKWARLPISELVTTQYGYTDSATSDPIGPKLLRGTDINKRSYIDWNSVPYCSNEHAPYEKYALQLGDVLVIRMADPGKVAIVETDVKAVFASYLVRLKVDTTRLTPYYLFFCMDDPRYESSIKAASGKSTRSSASAPLLTDYEILVPPLSLLNAFDEYVRPMRHQITKLLQQNAALRRARDLLLPRLMSGEIPV